METFLYNLFSKRINRTTYAAGLVISVIFFLGLYKYIFPSFNIDNASYALIQLALIVTSLFVEGLFFMSLDVRRWHDISGEEWWKRIFWPGLATSLLLQKGQEEKNKYGAPPKPGIDIKALFGF